MKPVILSCLLLSFSLSLMTVSASVCSSQETCECKVKATCQKSNGTEILAQCTALYGGFDNHLKDLQGLVNLHITQSFQYLLLASFFGVDHVNRPGFHKFFMKLSDSLWDDALHTIEYISKRGGHMGQISTSRTSASDGLKLEIPDVAYELTEVEALSKALDMAKELAQETQRIHKKSTHHHYTNENTHHDAELMNFLQNEFVSKHADIIRDLSGKITVLSKMVFHEEHKSNEEKNMALYFFDEILQE